MALDLIHDLPALSLDDDGRNAAKARFSASDLRRLARHKRMVLFRRKRLVAALVSIQDLELLEAIEDRLLADAGRRALSQFRRSGKRSIPLDKVLKECGLMR